MNKEGVLNHLFGKKFGRMKYSRPSRTAYLLRKRVKDLHQTVQKLKSRKLTRKESQKVALDYIKVALDPVQAAFLCSVVENATKKPRGRRYNKEAKAIALSLFLFDPRAYKNLREILKALPSPSLLRKMLDNNPVEEGFLPFVFDALKFATCQFDELSKYVNLSWDGINLNNGMHYVEQNNKDGKGSINGFIGGLDHATKEPASQAVVLMVRSIFGDFKQPIAYFNFDPHFSASKLEPIIKEAIMKLENCGLIVKTLVCDQAGEHRALYNGSFNVSPEKPYIMSEQNKDCKIYCMYDPPHLLKSVKSNLKRHVAMVGANQTLVTWKDIIDFYEADTKNLTRIAPKLGENHVYGKPVTNMNVAMAAQVFSRTVAGGIKEYVKLKILRPQATDTAEFCEMFNDIFDTCNSRLKNGDEILDKGEFPECVRDFVPPPPNEHEGDTEKIDSTPTTRSPYLNPLSDTSLHLQLWERAEEYIKSIKFFNEDTGALSRPPCLNGWLLTISSLRSLWNEMKTLGIKKMPTKYLNQDFVENFFSQVRYRNGHSQVSCKQFRIIFKFLLHQHIMDPSRGKNTNCTIDSGKFLFLMQDAVHHKLLPASKNLCAPAEEDVDSAEPDLSDVLPALDISDEVPVEVAQEDYVPEDHPGDVKFSSYLARRLCLFSSQCIMCKKLYTSDDKQSQHSILDNTESKESRYKFIASTREMQIFVHNAVAVFDQTLRAQYGDKNLGRLIAEAVRNCKGFDLLTACSVHQSTIPAFFLQTFIRAMMRYRMKLQKDGLSAYIVAARERFKTSSLASSYANKSKLFCMDGLEVPKSNR
jgi:Transposase protein